MCSRRTRRRWSTWRREMREREHGNKAKEEEGRVFSLLVYPSPTSTTIAGASTPLSIRNLSTVSGVEVTLWSVCTRGKLTAKSKKYAHYHP